jgi:hypothetical protein
MFTSIRLNGNPLIKPLRNYSNLGQLRDSAPTGGDFRSRIVWKWLKLDFKFILKEALEFPENRAVRTVQLGTYVFAIGKAAQIVKGDSAGKVRVRKNGSSQRV